MVIKEDLLQWFTSFEIKSLLEVVMLLLSQTINLQLKVIGKLLENSRREKFIHRLEAIFGGLT